MRATIFGLKLFAKVVKLRCLLQCITYKYIVLFLPSAVDDPA